jgi:uncharacterized membrane protein
MSNRNLVVAFFPSRIHLGKALDHLMTLKDLHIQHALVLHRATTGELVMVDDELGPDEGGVAGGTFGAALAALGVVQLGALALPGVGAIVAIGAGALLGGLIGRVTGRFATNLIDTHLSTSEIELLTDRLQRGHAALVLQLRDDVTKIDHLRTELTPYHAELVERVMA